MLMEASNKWLVFMHRHNFTVAKFCVECQKIKFQAEFQNNTFR